MRKFLSCLLSAVMLLAADAIVRKQVITVERIPSGKTVKYYRAMKRLTEFGRRYWTDVRILIDTEKEKIFFDKAYTINSKGEKIRVPENAFHTLLPSSLLSAPYFHYLKEKVVNFVGIDLPSESVLSYWLESNEPLVDLYLHVAEPALVKEWEFRILGYDRVFFDSLGGKPEVDEFMLKGRRGIRVKFRKVSPYPPEPGQPPSLPVLVVAADSSWKELEEALMAYFHQDPGIPPAAIKEMGLEGRDLADVVKWMRKAVKLIRLDMRRSFEKARSASTIYSCRYGTAPEVALLYQEILKVLGYRPVPFLSVASTYFSKKVPSLRQFREVGLFIPSEGVYLFADGTVKRLLHQRTLLLLEKPAPHFQRFPSIDPVRNRAELSLYLGPRTFRLVAFLKGNFSVDSRSGEELARWLAESCGLQVKLEKAVVKKEGRDLKVEAEGSWESREGVVKIKPELGRLSLPEAAFSMPRATPLEAGEPFSVHVKIELFQPERILYLPQKVKVVNDLGRFVVSSSEGIRGAAVEMEFRLDRSLARPEEVEKLRELWAAVRNRAYTTVIYLRDRL